MTPRFRTFGLLVASSIASALAGTPAHRAEVIDLVERDFSSLEQLYRELHVAPELSFHEEKSAARMAAEMRSLGWEVTEQVGGTGVVALLKNGTGPTVLVRCDMDGLPVREMTGLPFASKVRTKDDG